MAEAM